MGYSRASSAFKKAGTTVKRLSTSLPRSAYNKAGSVARTASGVSRTGTSSKSKWTSPTKSFNSYKPTTSKAANITKNKIEGYEPSLTVKPTVTPGPQAIPVGLNAPKQIGEEIVLDPVYGGSGNTTQRFLEPGVPNPDFVVGSEKQAIALAGNDVALRNKLLDNFYKSKGQTTGTGDMPGSWEEARDEQLFADKKEVSALENEMKKQMGIARRAGNAQKSAMVAEYGPSREGVVSESNQMLMEQGQGIVDQNLQFAQMDIDKRMEDLKHLQELNARDFNSARADFINNEMVAIADAQAALVEEQNAQQEQTMEYLTMLSDSGALAYADEETMQYLSEGMPGAPQGFVQMIGNAATREAINTDQQQRFDNQQSAITTLKSMADNGMEIPMDMMMNYSNMTGLPLESIVSFNQRATQIQEDRQMDTATKAMELQKLGYELDRESRGIVTGQLQNIDYLTSLYQQGASQEEIGFVKNALGIKDMDDPMYRLDYQGKLLSNQAQGIMNAYLPAEKQMDLTTKEMDVSIKSIEAFMKGIDADYYPTVKALEMSDKELDNYVKQINADYLPSEKQIDLKGKELTLFIQGINADYLPKEKELELSKKESEAYKAGIDAQYYVREKEAITTQAEYEAFIRGTEAEFLPEEKRAALDKTIAEMKLADQDYKSKFGTTSFVPIDGKYKVTATAEGVELDGVAVDGTVDGGQCGRFVNDYTASKQDSTGFGRMGDSFASKTQWIDESIAIGKPGMVFVMPYDWTGHTGIIKKYNPDTKSYTVVDSNWREDGMILEHDIPASKMTGFFVPGNAISKNVGASIGEGGILTEQQKTDASKLYTDYKVMSKEVRTLDQGFAIVDGFDINHTNPSQDQALIFSFMKVMDPGSTVREGEFTTTQNNAAYVETLKAMWNKSVAGEGMIIPKQRQNIIDTMTQLYSTKKGVYKDQYAKAVNRGVQYGINDPTVFLDYIPSDFDIVPTNAEGQEVVDSYGDYHIPLESEGGIQPNGYIDLSIDANDLF